MLKLTLRTQQKGKKKKIINLYVRKENSPDVVSFANPPMKIFLRITDKILKTISKREETPQTMPQCLNNDKIQETTETPARKYKDA